jgi:hypothetical protein
MINKRSKLVLLLLTVVVILANIVIYKLRDKSDNRFLSYTTNYEQLYSSKESPRIIGFDIVNRNELTIKLSVAEYDRWKIIVNDNPPYFSDGKSPQLKLITGINTYEVSGDGQIDTRVSIKLKIQYVKAETYAAANLSANDAYVIMYSNIPVGKASLHSIYDFARLPEEYEPEEVAKARAVIANEVEIKIDDSSAVRIKKLSFFLLNKLDSLRGIPSDELVEMSAYRQFECASKGEIKEYEGLWCENYNAIYAFFANIFEIPTRRVDVGWDLDEVKVSGHTFTESFIKENNQWAYVDINNRKLFLNNKKGDFLNAIEVYNAHRLKSFDGIMATIYDRGKILTVPYAKVSYLEEPYFSEPRLIILLSIFVQFWFIL